MKDFFKPEDFSGLMTNQAIAKEANEKLNKFIESCPIVYCDNEYTSWSQLKSPTFSDKKKARLAFIEEIKKEPCKHEPFVQVELCRNEFKETGAHFQGPYYRAQCRHCGVELQATWTPKGEK